MTTDAPPQVDRAPSRMKIPTWLDQAASWAWRLLLVFAFALAMLWGLSEIRVAAIPVLIAALVAATLHGPVRRLQSMGLPRAIAAALPIVVILGCIAGAGWFIGGRTASALDESSFQSDRVRVEVEEWLMAEPIGLDEAQIEEAEAAFRSALVGGARDWGANQGTMALTILGGSILATVLTFLFTKDGPRMWQWLVSRLAPARQAPFDRAGRAARDTMAAYLRSVAMVGIFDGLLIGIGLWIIGVPLVLPLVLLTALAALFPVVGAFAAGSAASIVALITVGPEAALWVALLAIVVQQVEGNIVAPALFGRQVAIHPALVLVALAAGGALAGLAGAFLAVPIVAATVSAVSAFNSQASGGPDGPGFDRRGVGNKEPMSTADDIINLRQLVADHRIAMISTTAPSAELHSRPVRTQEIDDAGTFWFIVSVGADWVAGLSADESVNLSYTDSDDKTWVSVAGSARLLEDSARVDRYRQAGEQSGHRIEDADVRLLQVQPTTVEYWDAPSGKLQALAMKAARAIGKDDAPDASGTISLG